MSKTLVTLREYRKLPMFAQGYVHYLQADWPGSELRTVKPPRKGTRAHRAWCEGQERAVMHVQDVDDD